MILFSEDWNRYPTAIVDTTTKNESFIHMARLYKAMGIKNHAWPLALIDPTLQGVDPHSPDLTYEQKVRIRLECEKNVWYTFREVIRLPPASGITPLRFKANRGNMALLFCFHNHVDAALIQPRQTHKSGSTDCLTIDLMDIRANNTMIFLITKDAQLRQANIERLKGIRSHLPPYLLTITREDADNQNELTNVFRGNRFRTGVGRNSESSANNLGRGMTASVFLDDEGPFTPFIGVTLEAALASGTEARVQAKNAGQPYGSIFTTTAGKKDSRDGRYMYNLIHSGATWDEAFLDANNQQDFEEMILKAGRSEKALANITMSHRQLGRTDQWLREAMAAALRDPDATKEGVERDFLNVWTSGSLSSPLSAELNNVIHDSQVDPSYTETTPERYTIQWYIPKDEIAAYMANGYFIAGSDTSEAIGRDVTAQVIVDLRDMSVVARYSVNETNLLRFGQAWARFLVKYPRLTWIPEKKSTGQALVDIVYLYLHNLGIDPFRRIFNRIVDEHNTRVDLYRLICESVGSRTERFYDSLKSYFGFNTSGDSRNLLYGHVLQEAAKTSGHLVRDKTLSSEIRELVMKNDRIDHKESGNDDHVIAYLLANWFARFARNLKHYGIDPSYVMRDVVTIGEEDSAEFNASAERLRKQLAEVEALIERLECTTNPILKIKLENRIKQLSVDIEPSLLPSNKTLNQAYDSVKENREAIRKTRPGQGRVSIDMGRYYSGY